MLGKCNYLVARQNKTTYIHNTYSYYEYVDICIMIEVILIILPSTFYVLSIGETTKRCNVKKISLQEVLILITLT